MATQRRHIPKRHPLAHLNPRRSGLGTVDVGGSETRSIEVDSHDWFMPVPYAQQVFSLVPAAAGVLGGLLLAQKFASSKATHVSTTEVITASALSFIASFAVVFLIKTFKSYDEISSAGEAPALPATGETTQSENSETGVEGW